jgi:hypothetical protein
MIATPQSTHIAYRCPECGTLIYGFVGKFALAANMLRLKCSCGHSALDITVTNDKKIRLSVPCVFCKQNHNYVVSQTIFFERDIFILNCPYANMDICFIGEKEKIDAEAERTGKELEELLKNLEAESIKDMQPTDLDEEDVLPDPAVYDTLKFLVSDLCDEGKLTCPCGEGKYDLRFAPGGVQVYCEKCGASYMFNAMTPTMAEEYLSISELKLK